MFLKKLLSNSLIYAIGPQIPKIATLFVLPIITKYLTSVDYGIAGIISAYTGLLQGLSELGLSVVLMNSFYNYPKKWSIKWRQIHFYLSIWAICYGIILSLILFFVIPKEAIANRWNIIFLVSIPAMFFNVSNTFATRYYQYAGKPLYVGIVSAIIGIIAVLLNLYTIGYLKMAYMGWYVTLFATSLLTFICYIYPLYFKLKLTPIIVFRKRFLISNLKISLPIIPHSYSSYLLNSSDRLVMERLQVKTAQIGEYNLAYTLGGYVDFFGNAIGLAIGPLYTKLLADKSKDNSATLHFITHWLQYSFLLFSFITALWSKEFFDILVSNSELKKVYPLAIIIIMGYAYRPYYWVTINKLIYSEKTSQLWKISLIASLLNVILNIIFIPIFGIYAAAITTYISLNYLGFSGYYLKVFKEVETQKYYPILFIILISSSTLFVYLLKDISIISKLLISVSTSIAYLLYTWLNKQNILNIKW